MERASVDETGGLGDLLRRARQRRALTLQQIARETKIPAHHLEALERDDLGAVPSAFYRRAEIRAYARAVHLDEDLALARLDRLLEPGPTPGMPAPVADPAPRAPGVRLIIGGACVAGAIVVGATIWRVTALDKDRAAPAPAPAVTAPDIRRTSAPPGPVPAPAAATATGATVTGNHVVADNASEAGSVGTAAAPDTDPDVVVTSTSGPVPEPPRAAAAPIGADPIAPADVPAGAPAGPGLAIMTEPAGARVTVNGIGWGVTPVTIPYLAPGEKRIRVTLDGYATEERVVQVSGRGTGSIDIRLEATP